MAEHLAYNTIEERVDVTFRSRSTDLRSRSSRFWKEIAAEAGTKIISTIKGTSMDAHVLSESSLFVFDHRMVMITCGASRLLDGATSLLWRMPDAELESLVYQRRGLPSPSQRDFKKAVGRLRSEAGDRLGSAVVLADTVLFHPPRPPRKPSSDRVCMQVLMRRLSPRVEAGLRSESSIRRRAAVQSLRLDSLFRGFEIDEHHFSPLGYSMNAIKGREYFTIHVSPQGPASFASFEFDGAARPEVSQAVSRVLAAFAPREHRIEALHKGELACLPAFAGTRWEPHPLGAHDLKSVLCVDPSSGPEAASA